MCYLWSTRWCTLLQDTQEQLAILPLPSSGCVCDSDALQVWDLMQWIDQCYRQSLTFCRTITQSGKHCTSSQHAALKMTSPAGMRHLCIHGWSKTATACTVSMLNTCMHPSFISDLRVLIGSWCIPLSMLLSAVQLLLQYATAAAKALTDLQTWEAVDVWGPNNVLDTMAPCQPLHWPRNQAESGICQQQISHFWVSESHWSISKCLCLLSSLWAHCVYMSTRLNFEHTYTWMPCHFMC